MYQIREHIQMKTLINGLIHLLMLLQTSLNIPFLSGEISDPFLSAEIFWVLFLSFYLYLLSVLHEKIIIVSRMHGY